MSVEPSSSQVTPGEAVTLLGKLACPTAATAAHEPIMVYMRQSGGVSSLSEVGTATTAGDGSYQFRTASVDANSVFVVRASGARSARAVIKVVPLVTLSGPPSGTQLSTRASAAAETKSRVAPTTFTGTVNPSAEGTLVTLQREFAASGEQWHAIAFARVGPEGAFSFAVRFGRAGEMSVRVVAHPKGAGPTASEALTYDVAQNQNPRLTILASADPVSAGQSLTITGVATEAADQPVALLASTPGHPVRTVATATTDGAGAYTFTVSPAQNTSYRVITSTTASTALLEGVRYPLTTATLPSTAVAGAAVTFSGTLVGARPGQAVYLERGSAAGFGFHPIGDGAVAVDGSYSYSIVHAFNVPNTFTLRIRVPADSQTIGSTSPQFTVAVSRSAGPGRGN